MNDFLCWTKRHAIVILVVLLTLIAILVAWRWATDLSNQREAASQRAANDRAALLAQNNAIQVQNDYLLECTTPGPNPPPNTGHKCFDDGQRRTGEAVAAIVDTNGNGVPDLQELARALGVTLPPARSDRQ
jgi:hypothetical protein